MKARVLIRFQIDFYLLYLLASTTYAGVFNSKLIENQQQDYNWELAWNHTNHRNPPWQDAPIKQIRKRVISEILAKQEWQKVTNFDWAAKPLSPALLDIFLLNQKTKTSNKHTYIRHLPLYRIGEEFPCAVIFESPDFTKIVEAIPQDRFYKNSTISIYGKFPANTVGYKSRIFLNLTMLPQVLSAIGLNIPDEAQIAFSKASATIRVNRFYHQRHVDKEDFETDSIHHDRIYNSLIEKNELGISIVQMHAGPEFNANFGRGLFLAGIATEPASSASEVFLIPADSRFIIVMLMDHSLHGTQRWDDNAPNGIFRTSYNFRLLLTSEQSPISLWQKIIHDSWE